MGPAVRQEAIRLLKMGGILVVVYAVIGNIWLYVRGKCGDSREADTYHLRGQFNDISRALVQYVSDNDDRLPPADGWTARISLAPAKLELPAHRGLCCYQPPQESPNCCAMNRFAGSKSIDDMNDGVIWVTQYLAQKPDAVTDLPPALPTRPLDGEVFVLNLLRLSEDGEESSRDQATRFRKSG
jgi:hypothetical protein